MNIFLPYTNISSSVVSLDDKRLNKQILECCQILKAIRKESKGYYNHPITQHYKDYPDVVYSYGIYSLIEYKYRFNKIHALEEYFKTLASEYKIIHPSADISKSVFYAERPISDPHNIRTTDPTIVPLLYQHKLFDKWTKSYLKGNPPKWTNRDIPFFYVKMFNNTGNFNY